MRIWIAVSFRAAAIGRCRRRHSTPTQVARQDFLMDGEVGFAGSANLTSAGLGLSSAPNLEITVRLTPAQCDAAVEVLERWEKQAEPVTPDMIDECEAAAKSIPVRFTRGTSPATEIADVAGIVAALLDEGERSRMFVDAMPVRHNDPERMFMHASDMWVANWRKPRYSDGTLLLVYLTDLKICTALVQATDASSKMPNFTVESIRDAADAKRWPWVTPVRLRLQVPTLEGVSAKVIGVNGQLRGGYRELRLDQLATALRNMLQS